MVAYQPAALARKGYAPLVGWPQRVDPKHDRLHHDKGRDQRCENGSLPSTAVPGYSCTQPPAMYTAPSAGW